MDIATHAIMGGVLAAPWIESHPASAVAFMAGSVAPDLDSLSRVFGKRAFLKCHQTYTHSIPLIAAAGLAGFGVLHVSDNIFKLAPLCFAAGMIIHVFLDVSNTFGTQLFTPLSGKRFSTEWSFFIDGVVWALNIGALVGMVLGLPLFPIAAGYGGGMVVYMLLKWALRSLAMKRLPATCVSLIPSALVPWKFLGVEKEASDYRIFQYNLLDNSHEQEDSVSLDPMEDLLSESSSNFNTMRSLSHAYTIVENKETDSGRVLVCKDLRTRNFKTSFGELHVTLDESNTIVSEDLHV